MNRFSIKSILATTPDGAPPKPSGLRAKCARLLPLTHTEAHVASVPLGGPDGDRMEKLLCINSNRAALAALLVLLAPLAAMSQSGMVCLQATNIMLFAQALMRASPLAATFLSEPLPDTPDSPACLELALTESFDKEPGEPIFLVGLLNYCLHEVLPFPRLVLTPTGSTFAALLDALAPACSAPSSHPLALTADELLAAKPDSMGLCDYAAIAAWLHPLEDRYKEGVVNAIISALTHPSILQMIGITGIDWQSIQLSEHMAGPSVPTGQVVPPHWPTRMHYLHILVHRAFKLPGDSQSEASKQADALHLLPALPPGGGGATLARVTTLINAAVAIKWVK